jgi:Icc-related predicted phosphoesterase
MHSPIILNERPVIEKRKIEKTGGIVFIGDIHGDFSFLEKICSEHKNYALVQVGDLGLGFNPIEFEMDILTKKIYPHLKSNNNELVLIAGNKDSKQRFYEIRYKVLPYNIYMPADYEVFSINDKDFICVSGAVSFDRSERILNKSYWYDEYFSFEKLNCKKADVLVTHTAPSWCYPENVDDMISPFKEKDMALTVDVKHERQVVGEVFNLCKPSVHVYGHFHSSNLEIINNCVHKLMDIKETWKFI